VLGGTLLRVMFGRSAAVSATVARSRMILSCGPQDGRASATASIGSRFSRRYLDGRLISDSLVATPSMSTSQGHMPTQRGRLRSYP
jgi:hypothetical protein